ncbi:hypothetical protein BpHYR1_041842 [Brachionus plicatilis]|uniref:Uncharacterized protein n=1 Tax=Brachionus plicatilis TaxID=10195 RepID=A0A3M7QC73_BRAPC|nr:hypothetical protein BpHYR1_041842 [Brachionus plicatilis]
MAYNLVNVSVQGTDLSPDCHLKGTQNRKSINNSRKKIDGKINKTCLHKSTHKTAIKAVFSALEDIYYFVLKKISGSSLLIRFNSQYPLRVRTKKSSSSALILRLKNDCFILLFELVKKKTFLKIFYKISNSLKLLAKYKSLFS